jgi:hypothetical protein
VPGEEGLTWAVPGQDVAAAAGHDGRTGSSGWDPYDTVRRATMSLGNEWTRIDDAREVERAACPGRA